MHNRSKLRGIKPSEIKFDVVVVSMDQKQPDFPEYVLSAYFELIGVSQIAGQITKKEHQVIFDISNIVRFGPVIFR